MPPFSRDKLLQLNQIGFIPGPDEEEEAFAKRVQYGLNLSEQLPEELQTALANPTSIREPSTSDQAEILNPALSKLSRCYDCAPKWIPLFFSNYKLPFWHGGCAWIFQMTEDSPTSSLIQLRGIFRRSQKYLGFYDREELLTHELSHVGRMMFQEPKFEELLAYRTSHSSFRRWLGPLVQSSTESALFLLLLFVLVVFDVFLLAMGRPDAYFLALWLKAIPAFLFLAAMVRLYQRQKIFNQCLARLKECSKEEHAAAIAYRLKDEEIALFATMSPQEIKAYAFRQAAKELRWQVIVKAYL